jgi:hypothetical protein
MCIALVDLFEVITASVCWAAVQSAGLPCSLLPNRIELSALTNFIAIKHRFDLVCTINILSNSFEKACPSILVISV